MNNQSRLSTISCISNTTKGILKAGLIILPDALFIFTIRTTSFEPPYLSKILPIRQCDWGISFIITITKSAACMISSSIFVRLFKWGNTHFSRTLLLQPELISTFFLSLLRVLWNFWDFDLVMLLQWANRLELMARSQTYHRWLRWKWKWTMEIFWKSEVLFCTKAIKLKNFVHIYPLHRSGSNVLFKKVFISSFYQTFFQSV